MMDKDFVMDAVANDWHSLEYVAIKLKADKDVVLVAVTQVRSSSSSRLARCCATCACASCEQAGPPLDERCKGV